LGWFWLGLIPAEPVLARHGRGGLIPAATVCAFSYVERDGVGGRFQEGRAKLEERALESATRKAGFARYLLLI